MDARRNTPSNAVPNFSVEDKQVAVELWKAKVPLKQVLKQAPGLQSHQFATAPAGDQVSVDTADGRHPVSQEPRRVHAEEAGGCYPERGQLHKVLATRYVHLKV